MKLHLAVLLFSSFSTLACPMAEGGKVSLSGEVTFHPANHASLTNRGGENGGYWIVKLQQPACFQPDGVRYTYYQTLNSLQLLADLQTTESLVSGQRYELSGTAVTAKSSHYQSGVLLKVDSFNLL